MPALARQAASILHKKVLLARRRAARAPDAARLEPRLPLDDVAEGTDKRERQDSVRRALLALPEPYRAVALLRWQYGLEPAEIA